MTALTQTAVMLYAQQQDGMPETLQDLVPGYLDELPRDPRSGRPLEYIDGDIHLPGWEDPPEPQ